MQHILVLTFGKMSACVCDWHVVQVKSGMKDGHESIKAAQYT